MVSHSSIVAWRTPWTEEPGGLQSMGSHRVRHDSATKQQQCSVNAHLFYSYLSFMYVCMSLSCLFTCVFIISLCLSLCVYI